VTSYDVRIYAIETRKGRTTGYRVRWTVAGKRFGETFAGKGLAESYRAVLITAARHGEAFSTDTGLPGSLERERRDVSFLRTLPGVRWGDVADGLGQVSRLDRGEPDSCHPRGGHRERRRAA
jgi:hypothetical protein